METERLIISEFDESDSLFILELLNSPGWKQFIGDRKINSLEASANYIQKSLINAYKKFGYGFWKLSFKGAETIGMCGLIKRDYLEFADIGYALMPNHFGMGYAFEASKAVKDYAQENLGMEKLMAITDEENQRSIQLLKKLGFEFYKNIQNPEGEMIRGYLSQSC